MRQSLSMEIEQVKPYRCVRIVFEGENLEKKTETSAKTCEFSCQLCNLAYLGL